MNANKFFKEIIGYLGIILLFIFFILQAKYIFLLYGALILISIHLVIQNGIKQGLFLSIILLILGTIPVLTEHFLGDVGKKIFVIIGIVFVIIYLIIKYKKGENIWY